MKLPKRILGFTLIVLAPVIVTLLILQAIEKISTAIEGIARTNTAIQWSIIILLFIPICLGLMIMGFFALKGEYDRSPGSNP